ncbi:MAG: hypothetical protein QM802_19455 [Agriterribacter sp.]
MRRIAAVLLLILVLVVGATAQDKTITGKVSGKDGKGLPGVSVQEKENL